MTGARLIVDYLKAHGVKVIFGMPGGHTAPIYDALYDVADIRHILARHEQSAAFMADGYARATGEIGVCLTTAGPGVTNASTGIAAAYADSVPMLMLSGQIRSEGLSRRLGFYHEMDQLSYFRPITKWNGRANSVDEIPSVLDDAFGMLTTGRPGPVQIAFPIDVLAADIAPPDIDKIKGVALSPPCLPSAVQEQVHQAAALLGAARRPLILAGGGVISSGACAELITLAELLEAPVLTTPMGKGAIPEDHPLSAGLTWRKITSDLTDMAENLSPLPELADVMVAVGCRFTQLATGNWTLRVPDRLIQIDIDEMEIGKHYPVTVGIVADAKAALCELITALSKVPHRDRAWTDVRAQLPTPERWVIEGFDLIPPLRETLDRDAIVSADITRLYYMMLAGFPVYQPRTFLHSSGFIAMGYGLPAAIGAKVAYPARQVVSVSGDGDFLMTCQELATAMQHHINVVAIVINDSCLSAIKEIQDRSYGGRHIAVDLQNPDFVRLAEAFGAIGLRVESVDQFKPALMRALEAQTVAVIEVRTPPTPI